MDLMLETGKNSFFSEGQRSHLPPLGPTALTWPPPTHHCRAAPPLPSRRSISLAAPAALAHRHPLPPPNSTSARAAAHPGLPPHALNHQAAPNLRSVPSTRATPAKLARPALRDPPAPGPLPREPHQDGPPPLTPRCAKLGRLHSIRLGSSRTPLLTRSPAGRPCLTAR
nr:formin-like protein 3 [Lolium perenne]